MEGDGPPPPPGSAGGLDPKLEPGGKLAPGWADLLNGLLDAPLGGEGVQAEEEGGFVLLGEGTEEQASLHDATGTGQLEGDHHGQLEATVAGAPAAALRPLDGTLGE